MCNIIEVDCNPSPLNYMEDSIIVYKCVRLPRYEYGEISGTETLPIYDLGYNDD